ncbi:MAG: bifunctional riboflavin kinase/FAD synthetase [Candidatus Methylomirabilales bacterium]
MEILRDIRDVGGRVPHLGIAIGTFDGVHAGHQRIIDKVVDRARHTGGKAAALTFVNHPLDILQPDQAPRLITPTPLKEHLLGALGIDLLIAIPFTTGLAEMEAEAFVREVLWEKLRVEFLCLGFDFRFGRSRRGTPNLLREMGKAIGFQVEVIPPITVEETVVKSALIRDLLQQGKVGETIRYLTRPYAVSGEVIPDTGRGRVLGFATANMLPPPDFLLPDGVYAGRLHAGRQGHDAAVNVGVAPTFGERDRRIEAHLLNIPDDRAPAYGQAVLVTFWERIRDEIRFTSPEELKAQVAGDIRRAREILSQPQPGCSIDWPLQE